MIIDLIALFKNDLTEPQVSRLPVFFLDIRTIQNVYVAVDPIKEFAHLSINSNGMEFKTQEAAIAAARHLVDLLSESHETSRLEHASVYAHQAGKAIKEVIQECEDQAKE